MSAEKHTIQFKLNGRDVSADVAPHWNMVELLQGEFGLTGARESCGQGLCGCCTVLMDGEAVTGCLSLAVLADGKDIETIESQDADGELSAEQRAFIESGGLQCGYCTPGILCTLTEFLETDPDPSEEEIRIALSGNLCRCTGYQGIVDAALAYAQSIRGPAG